MPVAAFDTLKLTEQINDAATQSDLQDGAAKTHISEVGQEAALFRQGMKSEFALLRAEMKSEFALLREEMKCGFALFRQAMNQFESNILRDLLFLKLMAGATLVGVAILFVRVVLFTFP